MALGICDDMKALLAALALLPFGCTGEAPRGDRVETGEARIVVMAPAAAEVLEILGVTDRVVGRGDFVVWPPALQEVPKVGAYHSPSVETVLSLGATLLLTTSSEAGQGAEQQQGQG